MDFRTTTHSTHLPLEIDCGILIYNLFARLVRRLLKKSVGQAVEFILEA
jgi:hypothetical protein